jgi:hypothetical protein
MPNRPGFNLKWNKYIKCYEFDQGFYFIILCSVYSCDVEGSLRSQWRLEGILLSRPFMVPITVLHFHHVWVHLSGVLIGGLA